MISHLLRLYNFAESVRRWRERRFTGTGLFVLGVIATFAAVGLETRLSMAYQVFSFLIAVFLIAVFFFRSFRTNLKASRNLPRYATVNIPFTYTVDIENKSDRPEKDVSLFEDLTFSLPTPEEFKHALEPEGVRENAFDRKMGYRKWRRLMDVKKGARVKEVLIPPIGSRQTESIPVTVSPTRRGKLRFAGLTFGRRDPFGLCRALHPYALPQSILVLPRRYPLPPIDLPGGRQHHSGGMALTQSVGEAEEYVALREYRPGDPLRRIHWKSFAKIGKPIVKEYQEEFFVRHMLFLDTFTDRHGSPAMEEAVSLAASFASSVSTQESLLDLIFVGVQVFCFTSGRGLGGTEQILEVLASVKPCVNTPFDGVFPEVQSRAPQLSGCICILLSWDEKRQKLVNLLRGCRLPVLVLLVREPDETGDIGPGVMMDIPDNFHVLVAGRIEEGLLNL